MQTPTTHHNVWYVLNDEVRAGTLISFNVVDCVDADIDPVAFIVIDNMTRMPRYVLQKDLYFREPVTSPELHKKHDLDQFREAIATTYNTTSAVEYLQKLADVMPDDGYTHDRLCTIANKLQQFYQRIRCDNVLKSSAKDLASRLDCIKKGRDALSQVSCLQVIADSIPEDTVDSKKIRTLIFDIAEAYKQTYLKLINESNKLKAQNASFQAQAAAEQIVDNQQQAETQEQLNATKDDVDYLFKLATLLAMPYGTLQAEPDRLRSIADRLRRLEQFRLDVKHDLVNSDPRD